MKVLPDEKMGQKLFSNRQILFRLHGFTPILVWPQALYSLICYVDGTRAAEDLFNERENKIMFVLALKSLKHTQKKKKNDRRQKLRIALLSFPLLVVF